MCPGADGAGAQSSVRIVDLGPEYTAGLAACQIACWREAYRGLVPDHVLDAFDVEQRTQQYDRILAAGTGHTVVAVETVAVDASDAVVGFTSSGPLLDGELPGARCEKALYALYVRRSRYGTGLADRLITTILGDAAALLWVFEDNPRARAFYTRHGFVADVTRQIEPFCLIPEIRMQRPAVGN
ncbi:MAG TPA: GNAT family N-acetyltransferase [Aldersonia sp.]